MHINRHLAYCWGLLLLTVSLVYAEEVTLNLKQADIDTLIHLVSERTGKNFVVDERVKGKVTVISAAPMDEAQLYQTFLSILSVHGFAVVPAGSIYKIVPEAMAKSLDTPVLHQHQSAVGDEFITQVVEVKNINAAQLIPILRPLVPQQGHLAANPENNVLVISDRAANIERLLKIIRRVDRPQQNEVDVIMLEHASAVEVVRIINSLDKSAGAANAAVSKTHVLADERTNSVLISGDKTERLRLQALITHLDTPLETVGNTQVVYLRYAKASDLLPVLQGVSDSMSGMKRGGQAAPLAGAGATPGVSGGIASVSTNIQADDSTNSLIITAAPDIQQSLKAVVRQLDVRRAQVLVEAVIAEVEASKTQELGVQWIVEGLSGNVGPVGLINFGSPGGGIVDIAASLNNRSVPGSNAINGANIGVGRYERGASFNFAVLLRALAADSSTNVLSTPSLVTLDNEEAEIHVGQNVPFITGQYTNTGGTTGSTNPFQTIQRQDVGIKLKVKPQINEGNTIKLEIEQEVSSLVPSSAGTADVVTNTRTLKTVVMIEDGNMLVLGGLIDESLTDTAQKVPGLGDLPLIGGLFRSQGVQKVKRNLMIFLHPVIIRDAAMENHISHGKYNFMRNVQLSHQASGVPFTKKVEIPVMPDLNEFLTILPGDNRPVQLPPMPAAERENPLVQ